MSSNSKGIFITTDLIKSKAWLSLTGASQSVYLLFRLRCKMEKITAGGKPGKRAAEWIITNNGEIVFPYAEAEKKYGISRHRFARAIDDLIAKGLLDIEDSGEGYRRIATLYRLSDRWRLYGRPDFKQRERKKSKKSNPGFKKGNGLWRLSKKKPSAVGGTEPSAIRGTVWVMRTLKNGKVERIEYNFSNNKWLGTKTA